MQVRATARAPGAGVLIARSIALCCREKIEGPVLWRVAAVEGEGCRDVEEKEGEGEDVGAKSEGEHRGRIERLSFVSRVSVRSLQVQNQQIHTW